MQELQLAFEVFTVFSLLGTSEKAEKELSKFLPSTSLGT